MNYEKVKDLFKKINIEISQEMYDSFVRYQHDLLEWNEKINLTAIVEDEELWLKHFVDSAVVSNYIDKDSSLIDVGTGAGFPGVPCKIIDPSINLTLVDSLNKRINFLCELCENLKLNDVNFVHSRAEDLGQDLKYRERFDYVTARAVANLAVLCELCLPFIKVGGTFICMKSGDIADELSGAENAIDLLGGSIEKVIDYTLPDSDIKRTIILIKKIKNTPKNFPRKAGVPSKKPL